MANTNNDTTEGQERMEDLARLKRAIHARFDPLEKFINDVRILLHNELDRMDEKETQEEALKVETSIRKCCSESVGVMVIIMMGVATPGEPEPPPSRSRLVRPDGGRIH